MILIVAYLPINSSGLDFWNEPATTSTGPSGHVYLVSAARTPIGKFGGALAATPAVALGGVAIRAAVERAGRPDGGRRRLIGHRGQSRPDPPRRR
jgi:hypothetical protein